MPRSLVLLVCLGYLASPVPAATDVRVNFTLNTADAYGNPIQQSRYYYVYRPDNLPRSATVPMVLLLEASPNGSPARFLNDKANRAGFLVVSCSFSGNSSGAPGTGWVNDDPRTVGPEDYDYFTEVINRVRASDNAGDAFIAGLSKGGHTALAYACERPSMIRAASSLDEFMGLTTNIPAAPVPIIVFQGTADTNVPYTMVKDTVDAWRAVNGLLSVTPVTTYESSPLQPGRVSQVTWRGGIGGTQVAFVTIIGGTHTYPTPGVQTGYDFLETMWAFFSRFLTPASGAPKIVSPPTGNVQAGGQPASFWVTASGGGPLRYQWQKDGQDIPGANNDWYTPATTDSDDGAVFRAIVSNADGSAASAGATLTVKPAPAGPSITSQPSDQAVAAGQPVSFSVAAAGSGALRYQWKKNGIDLPGATGASLSIPAAQSPDCGAAFTVAVTGDTGTTTSPRATLTVTPAPGAPIVLANPDRARTVVGRPGKFTVKVWSPSPVTYQWQRGTSTGQMLDIPGATDDAYTTPAPTLADSPALIRCVVSNAAGSVTTASDMMLVTATEKAPNDINSLYQAAAQTGVAFEYTISSSGGSVPLTFAASPLPDGLRVDAATGKIYGIPAAAGVSRITLEASNSAGKASAILTLTVTDTPPAVSYTGWRFLHFGASANDPSIAGEAADPDGDGYTNLEEFQAGSDPLDASSVPGAAPDRAVPQPRRTAAKKPSPGSRPGIRRMVSTAPSPATSSFSSRSSEQVE